MVRRPSLVSDIAAAARHFPVITLTGPRQCGKSTLSRYYGKTFKGPTTYFDLEDPPDVARLANAKLALERLRGLVIIDEVQCEPRLFPILRVLADRPNRPATFLLLGSASPDLGRQSSESLAGRVRYIEMGGFDTTEIPTSAAAQERLWVRGGFPSSYLAPDDAQSLDWRKQFIRTFLERDIPQLGIRIAAERLRRFWVMLARYHGQTWNAAEVAASLGVDAKTAQHYLDILTGSLVVRQLPPWFENVGKRVRKAQKVYLRDTGLLHSLLGIPNYDALSCHPKLGASWEGFALEQVLRLLRLDPADVYYWGVHGGTEIDMFTIVDGRRTGFEFKYTDSPAMTRSLGTAFKDLQLEQAYVVVPSRGHHALRFPLAERIEAVDLRALAVIAKIVRPGPTG